MNARQLGVICDGEVELCLLAEDDIEETLMVLKTSFFINEAFCIATDISLPENEEARNEMAELARRIAKDGISIIARHIPSNKIIGAAINKMHQLSLGNKPIQEEFLENFINSCKTESVKSMMKSLNWMEEQFDIFTKWEVDCIVELFMLSVASEFGKRDIGYNLSLYSIKLVEELAKDDKSQKLDLLPKHIRELRPKAIYAIFSSIYSCKIGKRLGFEDLVTIPFSEFFYKKIKYSDKLNSIHKDCVFVAKKI